MIKKKKISGICVNNKSIRYFYFDIDNIKENCFKSLMEVGYELKDLAHPVPFTNIVVSKADGKIGFRRFFPYPDGVLPEKRITLNKTDI